MAVASWMLRSRSLRAAKALRGRTENKDEAVKLDYNSDPKCLMREILSNVCQKHGISSVKKLNYLNALVHLISKNSQWKSPDTFGLNTEEILCCLRVALIQDSVQVRAAGLRALRYVVRTEEDILILNKLQLPYLISRSLDLLLKTDNERVLMSERIQSLKMMRHILFIAPQHFNAVLVRPLVSVALRPIEETDRLLKTCLAVLCELCVLNSTVFIECDGVRALLRNANTIPSSHMTEAICGALLFLSNKPSTRNSAKIELQYLISGYTNSFITEKNSFREEERRLMWTNFVLLTLLRSCGGLFQLCNDSGTLSGLKSVVKILYLNQHNLRKSIIELLFELINVPQPEWTEDETIALNSVEHSRVQDSFRLTEGYLVSEGKYILPNLSKNRVNLVEVHTSLILLCLLEADLPDALVEVIVSSDPFLSLQASILLGEFLHLARNLLPSEYYTVPPPMPNLISYATRGCPVYFPSKSISNEISESSTSYEQYSSSFSHCSKDFHYSYDCNDKLRNAEDYSKLLDLRLPPSLNVPDNITTKSSPNETVVTKDERRPSIDICNEDVSGDLPLQTSEVAHIPNDKNLRMKFKSISCNGEGYFSKSKIDDEFILNIKRLDFPPCKHKQRMALSAMNILTNLRKQLEKPRQPISLLLNNVIRYGEKYNDIQTAETTDDLHMAKTSRKVSPKVFDELIKETGVLIVPEPSRWKWESIRILLRLVSKNSKKLNDNSFKAFVKKLLQFYKPSSKKFSHTPIKSDCSIINIYTIVAGDLMDILLDARNNEGVKLLNEFLEDIDTQLKQIIDAKSVHDCLFSPQRLTNSLSQDYFLLLGRLSNCEEGLAILKKLNILQSLHHIAININMDCYVKLIVSSLSYVVSEDTRKIFNGVLSCNFVSSRLYATKYLHVLLRTNASKKESFRNWAIEMLVNQLHDENPSISSVALNALHEAADNKDCLDALISLRPSLLHLGDKGLLLLIRFLSTEKGFSYLQAANFVAPQLQRWAASFNAKYTQIIEGELHDAMSQYQRGDDGRYRQRVTDSKAVLKDVFVPPHLYGQLVQHTQGFNLLIKQEIISKMMQVIMMNDCDSDEAILELKSALWAMGHFSTSSTGAKFLSDRGIIKAIVGIAEKCAVYSVKATAFYVLSMIATTKEGVAALSKTGWRCLKRNRHDVFISNDFPFTSTPFEKFSDDDDSETVSSPVDFESPSNDLKTLLDQEEDGLLFKIPSKFSFERKSATLPQRGGFTGQIHHNRSYSESKADASDEWSSSGSPPSNNHKSNIAYRSDSCGTDSSTSGISSCDSVYGKPSNHSERISTLSPIPSTSSLTTVMTNNNLKEHSTFLSTKRHSSISFGCRLSAQSALGYKTLRLLQNRHQLGTSSFSATATMEYLSAHDRRQMSPLVRPKFPRYIHEPLVHEFEVKTAAFQIDENENAHTSLNAESSQFSHSTEIDEEKTEPSGPCYQGICLPSKLRYFLPCTSALTKKSSQVLLKSSDETEPVADSDSERTKNEEIDKTLTALQRKRRHDKSTCLLCSSKSETTIDGKASGRSRKTSTSSLHRIRTETESSYGGGAGPETESPILLTWQQKPVGLVDTTTGGASSSTLETSESQANSLLATNESSLKSRSILRKEVLKLIEQLGNPILHKTCKQCLLHLKQICGDLFQDVCLFSDVCSLLGSINYRIHARQLIQDLFLEAPFYELYEEPIILLSKVIQSPENNETKNLSVDSTGNECSSQTNAKLSSVNRSNLSKDINSSDTLLEERKINNHNLEVIVETDTSSEAIKKERDAVSKDGSKHHLDCRRAYSYPATSYIVTGIGSAYPNSCANESVGIPTTRSQSFSTTCSYFSEISFKPCATGNKNENLKTPFDTSSIKVHPQWC